MNESVQKKNRFTLVLVVAMFATPILAAIYLNSQWSDWAPETTRNHGQLVQPVLALPTDSLRTISGELTGLHATGKWVMVHLAERCENACRETLVQMRQIHLTTGFNSGKVAGALVLLDQLDQQSLGKLETEFPLLSILKDNGDIHALLNRHFGSATEIYLVDPLGNVMLRYAAGFDPSGVKKDLGLLLRYNQTKPAESTSSH